MHTQEAIKANTVGKSIIRAKYCRNVMKHIAYKTFPQISGNML